MKQKKLELKNWDAVFELKENFFNFLTAEVELITEKVNTPPPTKHYF